MNFEQGIEPVTVLKTRSAELIRRAEESRRPVVITQNGKATAVLQDVKSYQEQRQALLLLRFLARGERDAREGELLPDAGVDAQVRARLAAKKNR